MLKNQKGVTLLELIIAIGILALVIGPYLNQFVKATEIGERSERIVRAEYAAQKKLEEVKLAPDPSKNNTPELYEGFTVKVKYLDKTTSVNTDSGELNLYDSQITPDIVIIPTYESGLSHVEFQTNAGASKGFIQNLSSDQEVTLYLEETSVTNSYKLKYRLEEGELTDIMTLTKTLDEDLVIRVNASQTGTENQLLSFAIYNASGDSDDLNTPENEMSGRTIEIYEFDDDEKNYSFRRHIDSSADVNFYLKLDSDSEDTVDNDLDYYWVYITVENSRGELIYDLYSSVRKK